MKIRRINRTTEQQPDTYSIQIQYSASDVKNALIKAYGEEAIAEEIIKGPFEWFQHDLSSVISVMDLGLGKSTNFDTWAVGVAKKKGLLLPTGKGNWKPNREILRMKTGRTSAAVEKMLD